VLRREFLTLGTAVAVAMAAGARFATPDPPRRYGNLPLRSKKGLGLPLRPGPGWRAALDALDPSWVYTWDWTCPPQMPEHVEFVPMVFGYWGQDREIDTMIRRITDEGAHSLLGFNEPDERSQANLSVATVLDVWPMLMKTGLRLGSPACVHAHREWMVEFMDGVRERDLRVDFICMHSYGGPDADELVDRLEDISAQFDDLPLWLTEFAVGDWNTRTVEQHRHRPERIARFMREAFPRLETLECLERHAWYSAPPSNAALGTSALLDERGRLTELGRVFASL